MGEKGMGRWWLGVGAGWLAPKFLTCSARSPSRARKAVRMGSRPRLECAAGERQAHRKRPRDVYEIREGEGSFPSVDLQV